MGKCGLKHAHKVSHHAHKTHHGLLHVWELILVWTIWFMSLMFAWSSNLPNNNSFSYPLQKVSTVECRTLYRNDMPDSCKINLPIIHWANYSAYEDNGLYRSIYTALRAAPYSDSWNQKIGAHAWLDIATARGTPLYSIWDGEVFIAGWNSAYGNVVKIKYVYQWEIVYGLSCISEIRVCNFWVLNGSYQYTWCIIAEPNDCVFAGNIVAHWESITAYVSNSVPCWWTCVSETRTCENWILGWVSGYPSCTVSTCGWGWWWTSHKDDCCEDSNLPWANEDCEDYSPSYYDHTCEWDEDDDDDDEEPEINKPTTQEPIATVDIPLTRILAAEMIYKVALELWIEEKNKPECYKFDDLWEHPDKQYFAMKACLHWYMWYMENGKTVAISFNPNDIVTRAQISTVLSRLLYGEKYNLLSLDNINTDVKNYWAIDHAKALNKDGIINEISAYRLDRYETVQFFDIMINRTIAMLWDRDIALTETHSSAWESSSLTNALQNIYEDIAPEEKSRTTIVDRLKNLFSKKHNDNISTQHQSADILEDTTIDDVNNDNIYNDNEEVVDDMIEETVEEIMQESVEEIKSQEDPDLTWDENATVEALNSLIQEIKPDGQSGSEAETKTSPIDRLKNLFKNNSLK